MSLWEQNPSYVHDMSVNSANNTHGRLCSCMDRSLGSRHRCRTCIVVGVRVDLGFEDRLLEVNLLAHQTNAEDVGRNLTKAYVHLQPQKPMRNLNDNIQATVPRDTSPHQVHLHFRNDLYCVGWGIKLYSLTHQGNSHILPTCQSDAHFNPPLIGALVLTLAMLL